MNPRQLNRSGIAVLLIIFAVAVGIAGRLVLAREDTRPSKTAAPAKSSDNTANNDPRLAKAIDQIIDHGGLPQARLGVIVLSAKDGRVLYAHDADRLFMPASNMKIYTTAVALDTVGPDYRWRTSVYAAKRPDASGIVEGDLTLYGRGAPDLVSKPEADRPSLAKFADQLYQMGVREVRGNIVGDESYFRGELFGLGWQWNDLQWYFGAQPSALSLDENSFELTIAPGDKPGGNARVVVNPDEKLVHLRNEATTGERDAKTSIGIMRDLSGNDLRVWGEFPVAGSAYSAFLAFDKPALRAAAVFKQLLTARGIKVSGEARSRDFRVADTEKFDPQKATELAYQDSEPLVEITRRTNKQSNNLFAELLLRTIGKERGATAPDPDARKNRQRGDDEAGTAVVKAWLEGNGIPASTLSIRDGSGLSRLDLVSPQSSARLLAAMLGKSTSAAFYDSLPVAGRDGTLTGRLKNVTGKISAKTGSLTYVHSLSGYASTAKGETVIFSIMCNDAQSERAAVGLIDKIASAIIDPTSVNPK
jgi:serine-type D-Ala-D-Ala carboxypeptidase/endopeptidase (penicillin-binding protein 4)